MNKDEMQREVPAGEARRGDVFIGPAGRGTVISEPVITGDAVTLTIKDESARRPVGGRARVFGRLYDVTRARDEMILIERS